MKRRQMIVGAVLSMAIGLGAGPVMAADPVAIITLSLEKEGFRVTSARRTLLGRVRILATRQGQNREVVIDPRTGEVLRDLVRSVSDLGESRAGGARSSGAGGSSSGGSGTGSDDSGSHDSGHDSSDNDSSDHDSSDHGED